MTIDRTDIFKPLAEVNAERLTQLVIEEVNDFREHKMSAAYLENTVFLITAGHMNKDECAAFLKFLCDSKILMYIAWSHEYKLRRKYCKDKKPFSLFPDYKESVYLALNTICNWKNIKNGCCCNQDNGEFIDESDIFRICMNSIEYIYRQKFIEEFRFLLWDRKVLKTGRGQERDHVWQKPAKALYKKLLKEYGP